MNRTRLAHLFKAICLVAGVAAICAAPTAAQQSPVGPRPATRDAAEPKAEAVDEGRGGWRASCRPELKLLCRGAVGGSAKRRCLDINLTRQSPACSAALNLRRQQRAVALQACAADVSALCQDAMASHGTKLKCLELKTTQVSPACGKALVQLKAEAAGGKGAGKLKAAAPKN